MAADRARKQRRWAYVLLLVILGLGAWPRFQHLDFGLPHIDSRPDERTLVEGSERVLNGNLEPVTLHYPPLFTYVLAATRLADRLLGLAPVFDPAEAELDADHFERARALRVGRFLSALFGTLTILGVYALTRRVGSRRAGLAAAALFAAAHLAVRDAHFAVTDTALSLCVLLTLIAALACMRDLRVLSALYPLAAGAGVGLAAAMKYPGALAALPVALAILLAPSGGSVERTRALALAALAAAGTFCLLCPFVVLTPDALFGDALTELTHKTSAGPTPLEERGWVEHLRISFGAGLGWPLCALGLLGLALSFSKRGGKVLAAFALVWFVVLGSGTTVYARYMLPLVPVICVFAGLGLVRVARILPPRARGLALSGTVLLAALIPAQRIARTLRLMDTVDTRVEAARDLRGRVGRSERALLLGKYTTPTRYFLPRARFRHADPERLEALLARIERGDEEPLPGFDYIVFGDYFFEGGERDPNPDQRARLAAAFPHVVTFSPLAAGFERADLDPLFNDFDKLYLPLTRFEGVERMGPFVHIHAVHP